MKFTIIYDNEVKKPSLKADWGFSCLIEAQDMPPILFDTGASGSILLHNMKELGISPSTIGIIVISHAHWDHAGGLQDILELNKDAEIYLPASLGRAISGRKVVQVEDATQICQNAFTTGELKGIEQSLALNTDKGILVVVGCSHPGVGDIIDAAAKFGTVYGIVGGFHGSSEFERLSDLSLICPCHCTQYKFEIKELFPEKCLNCGAGMVVEL
ncbi:MAG TPA: MBL fold metallo-hydrolase [Dehalococcoidia bacterium]|nr:MBL fold metallo-hydrolase [Dehalococcoidia bacterium]